MAFRIRPPVLPRRGQTASSRRRACAKPCDKGEGKGSKAWKRSHHGQSEEIRVGLCGVIWCDVDHFWETCDHYKSSGKSVIKEI